MIIRGDEVLDKVRQFPEGVTVADMIDMTQHPYDSRIMIARKYNAKLRVLLRYGLVTRTGKGVNKDPFVWRAV